MNADILNTSLSHPIYSVKLEGFEGPLDLLLHLIQKEEMDIYDIQITQITDRYLEYVNLMEQLDLDIASDFLVMAATLLHIKSQSILPQTVSESGHPIGNQEQLVQQLLEYKRYKEAAKVLDYYAEKRTSLYNRSSTIHAELDGTKSFEIKATLFDLLTAFKSISDRNTQLQTEEDFEPVQEETVTVEEKITFIETLLVKSDNLLFDSLFPLNSNKIDLIVTFLAILELIRIGKIVTVQTDLFESIYIVKVDNDRDHKDSNNED